MLSAREKSMGRPESKERDKIDKNLELAWELKKAVEHNGDIDTNCNYCAWNSLLSLGRKTGEFGNQRKSGVVKIGLNTEESPGDPRKLAIIQAPLGTTSNEQNNNNKKLGLVDEEEMVVARGCVVKD